MEHNSKNQQKNKHFWQIRNQTSDPKKGEIILYGDISQSTWWGDEVTPREFQAELAALGDVDEIDVRICSNGGDVFAAQTIGNLLEQHPAKVTAHIDGICASAATQVACHCNKVVAGKDSSYMIHPAKVGLSGYYENKDLENMKAMLDVVTENIVSLYARKTGKSKEECADLMAQTQWWTGEQAKEQGFVDELVDGDGAAVENRGGVLVVNSIDTGIAFDNAPKNVKDRAGGFSDKSPAGEPENNSQQEGNTMANEITTVDALKEAYPDLVNQIENAAQNTAQQAERERMSAIDDIAHLFGEDVVAEAKYGEHPCTAQEMAYNAAVAAKKQGKPFMAAAKSDAENSGTNAVTGAPAPTENHVDDESAAKAQAKADAELFRKMKEGK